MDICGYMWIYDDICGDQSAAKFEKAEIKLHLSITSLSSKPPAHARNLLPSDNHGSTVVRPWFNGGSTSNRVSQQLLNYEAENRSEAATSWS